MTSHYRIQADSQQSLVWVLVDGRPRHVSDFASLPPGRRPAARCPECGKVVTLKLGRALRHHAAHRASQVCGATHPETALHLNCKLALAAALVDAAGPAATLSIIRRCGGSPLGEPERCIETTEWVLADAWDRIEVEARLADDRRPDLLLLRGGVPVAAIEIVVSNPVSPEKASALDALRVPWVEIAASERRTSASVWRLDESLRVVREGGLPAWRCGVHESRLRAVRVVDIYHRNGKRDRLIYRISEVDHDGGGLRLQRGTREVAIVSASDAPSGQERRAAIRAAFTADVERVTGDDGSFADSPMRWATGDAAENIVEGALLDRVGRDPTPLATTFPRRWFFGPANGEWFLPREMRGVRWDRAPLDAFAAHPAWTNRVVRERPIPEERWVSVIFAGRPIAAMFGYDHRPRVVGDGLVMIDVPSDEMAARRAIVVVERAAVPANVTSLAQTLASSGVEAVWISHPADWVTAMESVAWAPAGRDERGRGVVLIDGLGVFPAPRFVRALSKGDPGLTRQAIQQAMADRVSRLRLGMKR